MDSALVRSYSITLLRYLLCSFSRLRLQRNRRQGEGEGISASILFNALCFLWYVRRISDDLKFLSITISASVEDVELVDWKSKRVDNYSVYRFSSVKDRNACLQVVKEIICFNRFCRLHLLPLVSASSRRSAEGLEQRAMALAYEMLLYSVSSMFCVCITFNASILSNFNFARF